MDRSTGSLARILAAGALAACVAERRHGEAPVARATGPSDPVFAAKLRVLGYAE